MADARSLHTKVTKSAISLGAINLWIKDVERFSAMNLRSASSSDRSGNTSRTKVLTPSVFVEPGKTEFTVTFVPFVNSARLLEIANCIVFVAL
jgi:hypothetical protein